jgi:hypothetical protein
MAKDRKEYMRAWREAHKEEQRFWHKSWYQAHKGEWNAKCKSWYQTHKEEKKAYLKADVNSFGKTKNKVRDLSRRYLNKHGTKIPGYEIHHCFSYDDPHKFIYCPKELHLTIHAYLREHKIDSDSDHYSLIKHLLDDTVVLYGIE